MITVKISCPEIDAEDSFKLYSRFDFNVLYEVLTRFESASFVSEDYVKMFEPCDMPIENLHGGNSDEA